MPRTCSKCRIEKPLEDFSLDKYQLEGRRYYCRSCEAEAGRARRQKRLMGAPDTGRMGSDSLAGAVTPSEGARPFNKADNADAYSNLRAQEILRAHKSKPVRASRGLTFLVGDTHFPFHSKPCLSWILDLIAETQPDNVVQMGDLYDEYSFSKYPRSLNVMTPNEEIDLGRQHAAWFWSEIQRLAPKASCYQLHDDNHGHRAHKRALEFFAAGERFVEEAIRELHIFDGVSTMADPRGDLVIDGVVCQHGHLKFGAHARKNQQNTAIGHLHKGQVTHDQDGRSWELCVGWVGSVEQPVFSYAGKRRAHGTTLGAGTFDSYGPRFIPFEGA